MERASKSGFAAEAQAKVWVSDVYTVIQLVPTVITHSLLIENYSIPCF